MPQSDHEMPILPHWPPGWANRMVYVTDDARELIRVTHDGEVVIAEDITLGEAKDILRYLALFVRPRTD